ncbi:hypothetical protein AB0P21_20780 [Kribbella sp. NPDC056861]|uniref:hypothetical protein n=1 Tax=Kribbella sp. NPDC056861 TaxID=3154857 RepID=UPI003421D7CE
MNIFNEPAIRTMQLEQRRAWLEKHPDRTLRTKVSRAREEWPLAVNQMVDVIAQQYMATNPGELERVGKAIAQSPAPPVSGDPIQPADELNAPSGQDRPNRRPMFWRRHPLLTTTGIVVVCTALAVGVPTVIDNFSSDPGAAATGDQGSGDWIRSTTTAIGSLGGGLGIAYASDQSDHAKTVAAELTKITESVRSNKTAAGVYEKEQNVALREIKQGGAYMLRGMAIDIEVEGLADSEITIYDVVVRPASKPVPLGTAMVLYNSGGGDTPRIMKFNMDTDRPIARQDVKGSDEPGPPFFEVERIGLPKGHKESLLMYFRPTSVASEFDISILYEVNGKKYVEKVDLEGHPFRIAPVACPLNMHDVVSASEEAKKIAAKEYEHAYNFGYGPEGGTVVSPKKFRELRCEF